MNIQKQECWTKNSACGARIQPSVKVLTTSASWLARTLEIVQLQETHIMSIDVSGQRVSLQVYEENLPEMTVHFIYLYKQVVS